MSCDNVPSECIKIYSLECVVLLYFCTKFFSVSERRDMGEYDCEISFYPGFWEEQRIVPQQIRVLGKFGNGIFRLLIKVSVSDQLASAKNTM